jgi:hypothetical protein
MENENKPSSRKKFLSWGLGITAVLAIPSFLRPSKKRQKEVICGERQVKMLTQDGQLVWIDVTDIPEKRTKVETKDIHGWASKKKTSF